MERKNIIIIGATSGIGRALAERYLVNGHRLGVTGRRKELLQELKNKYGDQVMTACFDVTRPGNAQQLQVLINQLGGLDLLVYNAGIGEPSKELNAGMEDLTTRTNVNGFVEIVSFAFSYFAAVGRGQIALTSSVAALRGNSWAPSYSASKAFMSNYAEGLNIKALRIKKDILLTDIRPGFVNTKMAKGNGLFWVAPVDKAVTQIMMAIGKKKRVVYITRRWWLVAQLMRILPFWLYRRLA